MKYEDALNRPITRKRLGPLASEEQFREEAARVVREKASKLPMLFDAHGVPYGDWVALSLALAQAHVPGFRTAAPAGRPSEWSAIDQAELRIDVDEVRARTGKTVDASIREAIKSEVWREKTAGMKTQALRQHYYQADERWVRVCRDARSWEALPPGERARLETNADAAPEPGAAGGKP